MRRLLVSCGEASGDLYAAELIRSLRARVADVDVFGLGGDLARAQGATLVAHVRDLAVVGLVEVVSHLASLRRIFRRLLDEVDHDPPDAAVLIDYPDFNLRLARQLRKRGIRVAYFVSPQVWAWRRGRLRTIRQTVDRMLVIFPFEEEMYQQAGVPVTFVGHPLVDLVRVPDQPKALLSEAGLDPLRPTVALLPGSRSKEVAHNLPPILGAVEVLRGRRPDLQFLLAAAPSLDPAPLRQAIGARPVVVVHGRTHEVLAASDAAVVASGTATVETALLDLPMVVVYRLSPWTYRLGRRFVRVPHYAMVNLIAGRRLVTELIQHDFTAERVAAEVMGLLEPERAAAVKAGLAEVRSRLGTPGAAGRAAEAVLAIAKKP